VKTPYMELTGVGPVVAARILADVGDVRLSTPVNEKLALVWLVGSAGWAVIVVSGGTVSVWTTQV
jgi:hypothetical protein